MTPLRRLTVEYRESHDGHIWLACVVLLIDGEEVLSRVGGGPYIGLPPHRLASQPGLVDPSEEPSQVLLNRCDCGETGCGSVVARCYRLRDEVVWDRIAFGNPPPVDLLAPRPAADALVFSAEDYDSFVSRILELASRHPDVL
jgi:hypothetical protein